MKIIYVGLRHENYDSSRRFSFEYHNFFLTLKNMAGVELIEYPLDRIVEGGRSKFNSDLLSLVEKEKPDLVFVFMYTDELEYEVLKKIKTLTTSVAWFADDYWRFWNYSKHWPPYFSWVVTTYSKAVSWYKKSGHQNVIQSQWACDSHTYHPTPTSKDIDISFVGQYKSARGRVVEALEKAGLSVSCFGFGWPKGKVSQEEMISIFSRSRINLNLSARPGLFSPRVIARLFLKKSANHLRPDFHLLDNLQAYLHFPIPHTHARPFELAGCRAFVISGYSEDIGASYAPDKEMVFYKTVDELIEKINYYLPKEVEREKIAEAAYQKTVQFHTYEKRFSDLFQKVGLNKNGQKSKTY